MSLNIQLLSFRSSELTQILRDSFIGERWWTWMTSTISPGLTPWEQNLSSLMHQQVWGKDIHVDCSNDNAACGFYDGKICRDGQNAVEEIINSFVFLVKYVCHRAAFHESLIRGLKLRSTPDPHCFLPKPLPVTVGLKTTKNSCNVFHR